MNYDLGIRTIDALGKIQPDDVFNKDMAKAYRRMIKAQKTAAGKKTHNGHLKAINGKRFDELNPMQEAIFLRFFDETTNPERGHKVISPEGELLGFQMTTKGEKSGTAWNGFRDIAKAIAIARDGSRENIDLQLGMMHKVRSFYNNILSPMSHQGDVTIDTHAVAAAHLRPFSGEHIEVKENFKQGGKASITGAVGAYGLYADAYRQAAAEVGILPREMQSITWEAVRGLFTPGYKGQEKNQEIIANIWKKYDAGDITIDQARQEIFDEAGGINRAAWEGPGPSNTVTQGDRSIADPGNLSGPSLPRTGDGRGVGGEPAGPLLRTSERVNQDTAVRVFFDNEDEAYNAASGLIAGLNESLKSNPEGLIDKAQTKAAKLLDPEGRETVSLIQAGLNGRGLSKAEIETIFPLLVEAFDFMFMDTGALGRYIKPSQFANEGRGAIQMQTVSRLGGGKWLDVFLHELGHAIELQSGLREAVKGLKYTQDVELISTSSFEDNKDITPEDRKQSRKLLKELEQVSRERRPQHWASIDKNMNGLMNMTQQLGLNIKVPDAFDMAIMGKYTEYEPFTENYLKQMFDRGHDTGQMSIVLPELRKQLDYVFGAGELSADALAMYMTNPDYIKKFYPEVAAYVRRFVNNSPISKFITFHSIAGLVGAGSMTALLMGLEDEEERGVLSLGTGALSAA